MLQHKFGRVLGNACFGHTKQVCLYNCWWWTQVKEWQLQFGFKWLFIVSLWSVIFIYDAFWNQIHYSLLVCNYQHHCSTLSLFCVFYWFWISSSLRCRRIKPWYSPSTIPGFSSFAMPAKFPAEWENQWKNGELNLNECKEKQLIYK